MGKAVENLEETSYHAQKIRKSPKETENRFKLAAFCGLVQRNDSISFEYRKKLISQIKSLSKAAQWYIYEYFPIFFSLTRIAFFLNLLILRFFHSNRWYNEKRGRETGSSYMIRLNTIFDIFIERFSIFFWFAFVTFFQNLSLWLSKLDFGVV